MNIKKLSIIIGILPITLILVWQFFPVADTSSNPVLGLSHATSTKSAILAGGCFWCVEADLEKVPGVISAVSGYTGGTTADPTYENYAGGSHREVVRVIYDPSLVRYGALVEYVLAHSDPTDGAGSFYDRGEEYAPAVYYADLDEKGIAEGVIARIDALKVYEKLLAVKVLPVSTFWPAEEYHQDYYKKNSLKYSYYRERSGRDAFIQKYWFGRTSATSTF